MSLVLSNSEGKKGGIMNEKKSGNRVLISVLILLSMSIALVQSQKKSKDQPKYLYAHHQDDKKLQHLVVARA